MFCDASFTNELDSHTENSKNSLSEKLLTRNVKVDVINFTSFGYCISLVGSALSCFR